MEGLAIFHRQLAREGDGFRIVAVDVQDRRLHALRHVAGIGRAAGELRAGGEADLVVDDEVDAAAGIEIGRASCRERVCQYVWISVVAGTLKKKKTTE